MVISVLDYVTSDEDADCSAGVAAAHAALTEGEALWFPGGRKYRLSDTFVFSKRDCTLRCEGWLAPYGAFDDYLIHFDELTPGGNPVLVNVGFTVNIDQLNIDGEWQCRGAYLEHVYLSALNQISMVRIYGTAIGTDDSYETSWHGVDITLCKKRDAYWAGTETTWCSATAYTVGQVVRRKPAGYSATTTYGANDLVCYSGAAWRSTNASNLGVAPGTDQTRWVKVWFEYFKCMVAHTGKDPWDATGYTTNSSTPENRYWKFVLREEPILSLNNTYSQGVTDNQFFYGLFIRDSDAETLVYVDNNGNDRPAIGLEFYGAQFHSMSDGIPQDPRSEGQLTMPARQRSVLLGRVCRAKFVAGSTRIVTIPDSVAMSFGCETPGKFAYEIVGFGDISGEGANQIGIYCSTQMATVATKWEWVGFNLAMAGTGARAIVDPGASLRVASRTPFSAPDGSRTRPGYSFENYPTHGLWPRNGTVMSANVNGSEVLRMSAAAASLPDYAGVTAGTGLVIFEGTGTSTDVDLLLRGKGAGLVRVGTFTANADAAVTGYITVKDAAGNLRKIATIA